MEYTGNFFLQNQIFSFLSIALVVILFIFLFAWLKEPRRLINGVLFTIFLITLFIWITFVVFAAKISLLESIYELMILLILLLIFLLVSFSWIFFFWNAYFVWKYESHTLPNLLTLLIGIGLVIIWIISLFGPAKYFPHWFNALFAAAPAIAFYLLLTMYNFFVTGLLYQIVPRHYKQDYLIVLGAGLINGEKVSPLLASRINRAIAFSEKQCEKGRKMPKFIMSGGQGGDEKISEARAMANYAIDHGIKKENILLEDKSKNTYQNMLFSKKVAEQDFGSDNFRATFFSNNYHIFRAGLYAKMAKLKANGVGSYTRFYFIPNAVIREFAGVFIMHKKRHAIVISLIIVFFIVQAILIGLGLEKWYMI